MAEPAVPRVASPTFHATCIFSILVFAIILIASCLLRVEIVAIGSGKIIPSGRTQVVQPEFSGRITAICVDNGSQVQKGDLLLTLDATAAEANLETVRAEMGRLETEGLRIALLLEVLGMYPEIPETESLARLEKFKAPVSLRDRSYFNEQKRLLKAEINDLKAKLHQLAARVVINEKSAEVTRANIARVESALDIQRERLDAAEALFNRGTSSRASYLDTLQAFTQSRKMRDVLTQELDQKEAQTEAINAERRGLLTALRNKSLRRRSEIDGRLAALRQQERAVVRRINAARLTAPVTGTIDQLRVFTIGGIAQAEQTLMQVVPDDDALEIEARLSNGDIGFLKAGQNARIKLDAFPAERFGALGGTVTYISADAVQSPAGDWGFVVRIRPQASSLKTPAGEIKLRPGMTARINAITGDRTLISYFLEPVTAQLMKSLGER